MRIITLIAAVPAILLCTQSIRVFAVGADTDKRDQIRNTFLENYRQYEKYAFGSDIITPIAKKGANTSEGAGLGGTIVDALSTFLIMGLGETPEYQRALSFVKSHDFMSAPSAQNGEVSLYELTIRYIGGMLSAFQLGGEKAEQKFLIDKARQLADTLAKPAWSLPRQSIPFNDLDIKAGKPIEGRDTNIAQAGSLIMEWSTLSQFTGNKTYAELTRKSMDAIIASKAYFPGLWPSGIYPQNATASNSYITLGGGGDSFYEYLVKTPVLLGDPQHPFLSTYKDSVSSIRQHLASKTGVGNLTFTSDYSIEKKENVYVFSELGCYAGGIYAYAGKLLNMPDLVQFGLEIAESCGETYTQSTLGLAPYAFGWFDKSGKASGWEFVSKARRDYYSKHGYFVNVAYWLQQGEVISSLMYAHRITSQDYWRDVAWKAFLNMKKYASTETAWACVDNVNDESAGLYDQTGPYLFSETFNYLYLLFDDPNNFSLEDYVFTTQGHPLKRPKGAFGNVDGAFPYKQIYVNPASNSGDASSKSSLLAFQNVDESKFIEAKRIDEGRPQATKSLQSFIPSLSHNAAQAIFSPLPH